MLIIFVNLPHQIHECSAIHPGKIRAYTEWPDLARQRAFIWLDLEPPLEAAVEGKWLARVEDSGRTE